MNDGSNFENYNRKFGSDRLVVMETMINEGLPGVLGNKGTWPFTFREQGISQKNF